MFCRTRISDAIAPPSAMSGRKTSVTANRGMQLGQQGIVANRHNLQTVSISARARSSRSAFLCSASSQGLVVVTREKGKNDKLISLLAAKGITSLELPLIEHATGPDRARLPEELKAGGYDWVVVTSPESAKVFLEAWREAGLPKVRVATVGGGTSKVLQTAPEYKERSEDLEPKFVPSKATGEVLGKELPQHGNNKVLFPASAKSGGDLMDGLVGRGFTVNRLNTYDTRPATEVDPADLEKAKKAEVLTFASPSTLKAWLKIVGYQPEQAAIACIGEVSAAAARKAGLQRIYFPDKPGLETFVDSISEALAAGSKNGQKAAQ